MGIYKGQISSLESKFIEHLLAKEFSLNNAFILKYDSYGREPISKSNESFKNTGAEISKGENKEAIGYELQRLALTTTVYNDKQLQSCGFWPITPLESELFLKQNKLLIDIDKQSGEKIYLSQKNIAYWECLALFLYGESGENPEEANSLYNSIKQHQKELGLSNLNLKEGLLVINAGLEKDSSMPHGVKPIILPGLTEVYIHPILQKIKSDREFKRTFEYGLEYGLPSINELGKGERELLCSLSYDQKSIGLRVLCRDHLSRLDVGYCHLVIGNPYGRITFGRGVL